MSANDAIRPLQWWIIAPAFSILADDRTTLIAFRWRFSHLGFSDYDDSDSPSFSFKFFEGKLPHQQK
jgi:hypothetical protein